MGVRRITTPERRDSPSRRAGELFEDVGGDLLVTDDGVVQILDAAATGSTASTRVRAQASLAESPEAAARRKAERIEHIAAEYIYGERRNIRRKVYNLGYARGIVQRHARRAR